MKNIYLYLIWIINIIFNISYKMWNCEYKLRGASPLYLTKPQTHAKCNSVYNLSASHVWDRGSNWRGWGSLTPQFPCPFHCDPPQPLSSCCVADPPSSFFTIRTLSETTTMSFYPRQRNKFNVMSRAYSQGTLRTGNDYIYCYMYLNVCTDRQTTRVFCFLTSFNNYLFIFLVKFLW